jgi:hypothetical protein
LAWPYCREKDRLDAMCRIGDPNLGLTYPRGYGSKAYAAGPGGQGYGNFGDDGGWMVQ